MRAAFGVGLILLAIGYWACTWTSPQASRHAPPPNPWRRTIDGWEPNDRWQLAELPVATRLHPGVAAAGQLLASLLALSAARPRDEA